MSTPTTSEATEPPPRGEEEADKSLEYKLKAGAFLAFTGGFGMLAGFAGALGQAKKQDPASFDKGMTGVDAKVEAATKEAVRNLDNAALERIRQERALHESGRARYSSELQLNRQIISLPDKTQTLEKLLLKQHLHSQIRLIESFFIVTPKYFLDL